MPVLLEDKEKQIMEPENKPQGQQDNHQSEEDIIKGATNEDQLDKLKAGDKENVQNARADETLGATPDAYQYERKLDNDDTAEEAAD